LDAKYVEIFRDDKYSERRVWEMLLLLLLLNRLPPDITGGQGLKNIFQFFLTKNTFIQLQ
jgi:hypothetical protein